MNQLAPKLDRAVKDSKAPAISRAAAVLRLLGKSDAPQPLQAIARELGLVPSTCLYVLRALVAEELVAFDPDTKRYALEAGVLTLARQWLRRNQFADLAQPVLDRLSQQFGATMLGVQIMGLDHIVTVAAAQGAGFQLNVQVGSRFPALISATGRCIAAWGNYPDAELEARFARLRWEEPPTFAEWQAQVAQTRAQGFGIDEGNYIAGVTVLAAPVWRAARARPSHALVAIGIGAALKRNGLEELEAALVAAAGALSGQLAG
ncbi:MAG: IclR family transcriptional regulator [Novosphingobium sp.]